MGCQPEEWVAGSSRELAGMAAQALLNLDNDMNEGKVTVLRRCLSTGPFGLTFQLYSRPALQSCHPFLELTRTRF